MPDRNTKDDELDLIEARLAVASANASKARTQEVVQQAQRASSNVREIILANGFVERFRTIIQGS